MRNLSFEIFQQNQSLGLLTQRCPAESLGAVVTAPASGTRSSGWRVRRWWRRIASDLCLSGDELGEGDQLRDFEAVASGPWWRQGLHCTKWLSLLELSSPILFSAPTFPGACALYLCSSGTHSSHSHKCNWNTVHAPLSQSWETKD